MKYLIALLAALVGAAVAGISYYTWDSARNRGYPFGYYGEFNTVSNALAQISGIEILGSWYNGDVTLEEFGFEIRTADGRPIKLFVSETDPIRKMSGKELEDALVAANGEEPSGQTSESGP
jgi:hypothetical protein